MRRKSEASKRVINLTCSFPGSKTEVSYPELRHNGVRRRLDLKDMELNHLFFLFFFSFFVVVCFSFVVVRLFVCLLWLVCWFVGSFVSSLIRSFVHILVCSFVRSFVLCFVLKSGHHLFLRRRKKKQSSTVMVSSLEKHDIPAKGSKTQTLNENLVKLQPNRVPYTCVPTNRQCLCLQKWLLIMIIKRDSRVPV